MRTHTSQYLAGEDPSLGYAMAYAAVQGIQSQGVIANAKHYMNNNQVRGSAERRVWTPCHQRATAGD